MASLTERSLDAINRLREGDTSLADFVYKFGFNDDIDSAAEETVWDQGGLYNYMASPGTLQFSSTSADDTSAGTGARTIVAEGLDGSYDEIREEITLNGQTPVVSNSTFFRIFRMYVRTAGSSETAGGDIYAGTGTVTAGVPASVHARITLGENQTLMAVYTIPKNKLGLLVSAGVNTGKNPNTVVNARAVSRTPGGVFRTGGRYIIANRGIVEAAGYPLVLTEGTDYEIRAATDANNTDVSASFQIMIVSA